MSHESAGQSAARAHSQADHREHPPAANQHVSLALILEGKLRTKFLLSLLLISTGLTWATLLLVRHRVQLHVRAEIFEALIDSVTTFQNFQHERNLMFTRSSALLANLSSLKAL